MNIESSVSPIPINPTYHAAVPHERMLRDRVDVCRSQRGDLSGVLMWEREEAKMSMQRSDLDQLEKNARPFIISL